MRYQLSKEAVASPQCIWMSKFAPNRASHCCAVTVPQQHLGTDFFLNPSSSVNTKRTVSRLIFTSSAIRSNRFSYPCCAVTCPCFWWSSAVLFVFSNGSTQWRTQEFCSGGGGFKKFSWGQIERRFGGDSRGSWGSCDFVQEISLLIVKCS